jgi:hypothetical protein
MDDHHLLPVTKLKNKTLTAAHRKTIQMSVACVVYCAPNKENKTLKV